MKTAVLYSLIEGGGQPYEDMAAYGLGFEGGIIASGGEYLGIVEGGFTDRDLFIQDHPEYNMSILTIFDAEAFFLGHYSDYIDINGNTVTKEESCAKKLARITS